MTETQESTACVSYDIPTNIWAVERELHVAGHVIPAGFKSDLASVPRFFWRLIAPYECSLEAAIVHDWVYKKGFCYTRVGADLMLREEMKRRKVVRWRRVLAYRAVRLFAWVVWNKYRAEDERRVSNA